MKVAVCISGELRTYKETFRSLKTNLLDPYNADVFISSWTTTSALNEKGEPITLPIKIEEINEMYAPKGLNLFEFDNSMFYEHEGVKVPEELIKVKPKSFRANIPQFYLMKDCNQLKSDYERKNGFKYDIVIRNRGDLLIYRKINLKRLDLNKVHLKHIIKDTFYCDQFAVGSSELMDQYTSVFDNLKEYWKDPIQDGQFKNILNGETLMRHHILTQKIPHARLFTKFPIIRFNDSKITVFKKIYLENLKNRIKILTKRI